MHAPLQPCPCRPIRPHMPRILNHALKSQIRLQCTPPVNHSSRMRTASNFTIWGSPWQQTTLDRDPPLWTEIHLGRWPPVTNITLPQTVVDGDPCNTEYPQIRDPQTMCLSWLRLVPWQRPPGLWALNRTETPRTETHCDRFDNPDSGIPMFQIFHWRDWSFKTGCPWTVTYQLI